MQRILETGNESAARRVGLWFLMATDEDATVEAEQSSEVRLTQDIHFVDLATMVDNAELSSTAAKQVFYEMLKTSEHPKFIAERLNLIQMSDESAVIEVVEQVLADPASAKAIEDIRNGNDKVIGFLVGQVMKKSQGKANPALAQKLIRERL